MPPQTLPELLDQRLRKARHGRFLARIGRDQSVFSVVQERGHDALGGRYGFMGSAPPADTYQ